MKRILLIVIALGLIVFLSSLCFADGSELKIGAILPLTGDNAPYGVALKKGMDIAIKEINEKGINGKKLKVVFEDTQADAKMAISAFNKLASTEKVSMVIGDMFSGGTLAVAPIAEKRKIVLLSPTASSVDLTNSGDYIFRIYPSDSYDGVFLAEYAKNNLKSQTVSIIHINVSSVSAITQVFKDKFESLGGTILSTDGYNEGAVDFKAQLLKAKEANADIIFIPGYLREMALLLKQAKELGIKKQFLTISTFFDPKVIELAGNATEGVLFSTPTFDPESDLPEMKKFVNLYKAEYNKNPDILAGYGYDVVMIAADALVNAKEITPDNIKSALYKIKDFPGVTGNTSFDNNGDVVKSLKVMQVKGGKFIEFK